MALQTKKKNGEFAGRKITHRMWVNDKFNQLSKMQPSAQGLWIYLITGPHSETIPGLMQIGPASLAENIEWPLEDVIRFMKEIELAGLMKFDEKNRLIWIPSAITYNIPSTPKVIMSWKRQWAMTPKSYLLPEIWEAIHKALAEVGDGFAMHFERSILKPVSNDTKTEQTIAPKAAAVALEV